LIENVLTVYNAKLLSTGIAVDTRFNDLQKIAVSKGELIQIFSNIIANAADAMRKEDCFTSVREIILAPGEMVFKSRSGTVDRNKTGASGTHLRTVFTTKGAWEAVWSRCQATR